MGYLLRYSIDGQENRLEVNEPVFLIGRAPDCDLVLTQPGVSRHHCKITIEADDQTYAEDLQSKNGTRVNNVYIKKGKISPGDSLMIAEFLMNFDPESHKAAPLRSPPKPNTDKLVLLSERKKLHEESGTIISKVYEFQEIIERYDQQQDPNKAAVTRESDSKRIMRVLIEVAKALIAVKSLDQTIEKLMDLIFEYLPADRGFLMLVNEAGALEPKVVKHRSNTSDSIEISKTIADKALYEKMAILTTDAQVDPRFSAGESIRFLGIKSAMCVPLFHKEKTIGIIYLDSPTSAAMFIKNDLDLLTAMANFAAVTIEQAQLSEKILRETSMRQRLERYHSPSIVNRILRDITQSSSGEAHLLVQEREVSVIFADICGFTSMAERMPPNKVATLLNEYFSEMTEIIFNYEGTLDKYIGDAIMAVFGAPNTMEDHPYRAVSTALDMLARMEQFNAGNPVETRFAVRIGINSGKAVAGDIGSIKRMDYTVLGNTVNIASRIESMACKPGQVVVGESTYEAVKEHFICESLGPIRLKGISEETNVYRIIQRA